jgi:hypothetical protein
VSDAGPAVGGERVTDTDRRSMVERIQRALAEDQVPFEELDHRFEQVYRAETRSDLELAAQGLPEPILPPPPVVRRHLAPATSVALIGDVELGGWMEVGPEISVWTLIGDAVVDLSSAALPPDGARIRVVSLIGDVKVILPDGAQAQIETFALIGDRVERLVPPLEGAPTIRISFLAGIGDVAVYSLSQVPAGPLRRLWSSLRRSPRDS